MSAMLRVACCVRDSGTQDDALWVSRPADCGARAAMRLTFDGANPSPTVTPFGVQDVQVLLTLPAIPRGTPLPWMLPAMSILAAIPRTRK